MLVVLFYDEEQEITSASISCVNFFLVSGFLNQMQQVFIRKFTYTSFRDKRMCVQQ